jgi:antitoxin MazE
MGTTLKLTRIGNSRGIRLPKRMIDRYGIEDEILIEERDDNLVLIPVKKGKKLDWETTYREMAVVDESWEDWDVAVASIELDRSESW